MVYIARNPKDVVVSYFHLVSSIQSLTRYKGKLEDFVNSFLVDRGLHLVRFQSLLISMIWCLLYGFNVIYNPNFASSWKHTVSLKREHTLTQIINHYTEILFKLVKFKSKFWHKIALQEMLRVCAFLLQFRFVNWKPTVCYNLSLPSSWLNIYSCEY